MAKLHDLTGMTFGNWLVLRRNGSTPNKAAIWHCKCLLCGSERDVVGASLFNGLSTKCRSCVPKMTLSKPYRKDRLYHIYTAIKQRCTNTKSDSYPDYGGRGIAMCAEWLNSPDAFIDWALSNGYANDLTIDRIDVNGNYEPSNCRWITNAEQSRNKRSSIRVECNGSEMILLDACAAAGVNYGSVRSYKQRKAVDYQTAFDHYAKPAASDPQGS